MADLAWELIHRGYQALPEARTRQGRDPFVTRLLGRRTVVVRGRRGAELFYDQSVVRRRGAVPPAVSWLLFGRGAVHGLDGAEHEARKAMFLDILTAERTAELATDVGRRLAAAPLSADVSVFDLLVRVYGEAVLAWAGVRVDEAEARRRSRDLAAIVDGFGNETRAHLRGWRARHRAERWAREEVTAARAGRRDPAPGTTLDVLARGAGAGLDTRTAAVELLNVLRPTVAVAWPGTFAALALIEHPELVPALAERENDAGRRAFAHEVRRLYPFVPALAGRIRRGTTLGDVELRPGDRIVLDVPGTDNDPACWHDPDELSPERFGGHDPDPFAFVPQGGGDVMPGHRCPGEPLTVAILQETVGWLARHELEPVSAPEWDPARMPTLPMDGLRVRLRPSYGGPG